MIPGVVDGIFLDVSRIGRLLNVGYLTGFVLEDAVEIAKSLGNYHAAYQNDNEVTWICNARRLHRAGVRRQVLQ